MATKHTAKVTAVVLGGRSEAPLEPNQTAKALLPINGVPMGQYVLSALKASSLIDAITYVGESCDAFLPYVDATVPSGKRVVDSLALGLGSVLSTYPEHRVLIATADLPWLTTQAVDRFLEAAPQAALVYPIVPKRAARAQFPSQQRTYVRFQDLGQLTGGNLFLLTPAFVPTFLELSEQVFRARKNPLALSLLFGFDVVIKLLLGRAKVSELERRASQRLGAPLRTLLSEDASLAADIDKAIHLQNLPPLPELI